MYLYYNLPTNEFVLFLPYIFFIESNKSEVKSLSCLKLNSKDIGCLPFQLSKNSNFKDSGLDKFQILNFNKLVGDNIVNISK